MNTVRIITYLRSHTGMLCKLAIAMLVLLVVADALPFVVDKTKAHTAVERLPGFWSAFGLAGCLLLIFTAKAAGACGLQKREEEKDG
jgi:hypothetical protein